VSARRPSRRDKLGPDCAENQCTRDGGGLSACQIKAAMDSGEQTVTVKNPLSDWFSRASVKPVGSKTAEGLLAGQRNQSPTNVPSQTERSVIQAGRVGVKSRSIRGEVKAFFSLDWKEKVC